MKRVLDKIVGGFFKPINQNAKRYANLVYNVCVREYAAGEIFLFLCCLGETIISKWSSITCVSCCLLVCLNCTSMCILRDCYGTPRLHVLRWTMKALCSVF